MTPLEFWREVCEAAPAIVVRDKRTAERKGKHLLIQEDDLVRIGAMLESVKQVGEVWTQQGPWPRGDLNVDGRMLRKGTPLYSIQVPE